MFCSNHGRGFNRVHLAHAGRDHIVKFAGVFAVFGHACISAEGDVHTVLPGDAEHVLHLRTHLKCLFGRIGRQEIMVLCPVHHGRPGQNCWDEGGVITFEQDRGIPVEISTVLDRLDARF